MPKMSGAEHLRDWMRKRGFTQADAARYLDWNEAYLSRLINQGRNIGLGTALHLYRLTGIPVDAWASNELDESESAISATGAKRKVS